jgi:hypothetical protein
MSLSLAVLFAIFHAVKVKTYGRNNNFGRCLQNRSLLISNTFGLTYTPIEFYEQAGLIL